MLSCSYISHPSFLCFFRTGTTPSHRPHLLLPLPYLHLVHAQTLQRKTPNKNASTNKSEAWLDGTDLPILSYVNKERLVSAATNLHHLLHCSGSCLLVGPAGCGKSLVWKTLVVALQGVQSLRSPQVMLAGLSYLSHRTWWIIRQLTVARHQHGLEIGCMYSCCHLEPIKGLYVCCGAG